MTPAKRGLPLRGQDRRAAAGGGCGRCLRSAWAAWSWRYSPPVASRYQPTGNGEDFSFEFPALPGVKGFRVVNNLGGFHQDIYVPPQRGTFALRRVAVLPRGLQIVLSAWRVDGVVA